jgi:serine/threonine-protein kinase
MGLVEGESLGSRLKRRGKLPPEEARRIMRETADALSAAHAVSVIHRDIKPDNILLEGTRGRVMVTDFGIAKAVSSTTGHTLTGAGIAIGTPQFMSPEQAAVEKTIDAARIYSWRGHRRCYRTAVQRTDGRGDPDEADHRARAGDP